MAEKGFMNLPLALGMGILGGLRPTRAPQNFFSAVGPGLAQGLQMYAASQPKPQSELEKLRIAQIQAQMARSAELAAANKAYVAGLPEEERAIALAMGAQNHAQSVMNSRKPPKAGKTQMLPISDTHSQLHQVGPDGIPVPVPNAPIVARYKPGDSGVTALATAIGKQNEQLALAAAQKDAKERGKRSAENIEKVRNEGIASSVVLRDLAQLRAIGDKLKTGVDVGVRSTLSRLGKVLGVEIPGLEDTASLKQAYDALTNRFVTQALSSGQFPANNFSNADLRFLQSLNPSAYNEPEANKIIIDAAVKVYGYSAKRMEFFNRKIAEAKKNLKTPIYSDIEDEWQTSESNPLRRDVINAANALGDDGYVLFKDEVQQLNRLQSTSTEGGQSLKNMSPTDQRAIAELPQDELEQRIAELKSAQKGADLRRTATESNREAMLNRLPMRGAFGQ